jgi:hypothetical protein
MLKGQAPGIEALPGFVAREVLKVKLLQKLQDHEAYVDQWWKQ